MFAVIDFETSGLGLKARATEVGIVLLDEKFQIEDTFHSVLNPAIQISKRSLGYSRLQQKEIEIAPTFKELWPLISKQLSGRIIVAHGVDFDLAILQRELALIDLAYSFPAFCTLKLSRSLVKPSEQSHELGDICERFDIPLLHPHEALQDALATAAVFRKFIDLSKTGQVRSKTGESIQEEILELQAEVIVLPLLDPQNHPQHRVPVAAPDSSGIDLHEIAKELLSNEKVSKQKIVVKTGTLQTGEGNFEKKLNSIGLRLKETPPTAGTAFLVVGEKPGKSKAEKARGYGRPVLGEQDALKLIELLGQLGGF